MPFTAPEHPRPVVAKMYVQSVTLQKWGTVVTLNVVSRGADNKAWAAASPSGKFEITVANEVAAEQFFPDQEWMINMTPVPSEKLGTEGMDL